MNTHHCTFCSYIPPYMLEKLALSKDEKVRKIAVASLEASAHARATRQMFSAMPTMAVIPSPNAALHRRVYDLKESPSHADLPGDKPVREEGQKAHTDVAVNEAYDFSGKVYEFFDTVFGRKSIDGKGMTLISTVHFGRNYVNAFWNGEQMVYGDGDNVIFSRFTKSLDVIGHELTHGITDFTSGLIYEKESGALNEHFSDVMGVLVQQWSEKKTADKADWRIGDEIMLTVPCLRTMTKDKAYTNDPLLGDDPQPKHMRDFNPEPFDNYGVHINSGIPNYAFYLVATELGGNAWEKAGKIWFETFTKKLTRNASFQDAADETIEMAGKLFGKGKQEQKKVAEAWDAVGLKVLMPV